MDWYGIAILVAIVAVVFGLFMIMIVKPKIKVKSKNKMLLHICNMFFVIGVVVYISFLICSCKGKHYNSRTEYEEYPIEKVTFSSVYFNGRGGDSFSESWIILENPNNKYENIVVEEKEYFTLNWLFRIKTSSSKYHVYLSEEVFNRFQDGDVIYRNVQ